MIPAKEKENKRPEILAAGAHLFRTKGYERATTRELAGAVDLQPGSLFHYFATKEAILRAIVEEALGRSIQTMHDAIKTADTVQQRLRALIRVELEAILGDRGDAMFVTVFEWRKLSEDNQKDLIRLRDEYEGIWLETLQEAQDEGLLEIGAGVLRRFLKGALSWTVTWFTDDGPMDLDSLADQALAMALPDRAVRIA